MALEGLTPHPENIIDEFPGLKGKIKSAFTSGPLLPEDERVDNSGNRPRNDSFVLLLAGKLHKVGIEVIGVEGLPRIKKIPLTGKREKNYLESDIWVRHAGLDISIECKRPSTFGAIEKRTHEARKQLDGKVGIIAIDCSISLRPSEMILDAPTSEKAANFLSDQLASKAVPIVEKNLGPNVIGAMLHMRTPIHTIDKVSQILDLTGNPVTSYTQETASSVFFAVNAVSPKAQVFRNIKDIYMSKLSEGQTENE